MVVDPGRTTSHPPLQESKVFGLSCTTCASARDFTIADGGPKARTTLPRLLCVQRTPDLASRNDLLFYDSVLSWASQWLRREKGWASRRVMEQDGNGVRNCEKVNAE